MYLFIMSDFTYQAKNLTISIKAHNLPVPELTESTWTTKIRSTCAGNLQKSTRSRSTKSIWTRSKIHLCEGDGVVLSDVALVKTPFPLHFHVGRRVTVCGVLIRKMLQFNGGFDETGHPEFAHSCHDCR